MSNVRNDGAYSKFLQIQHRGPDRSEFISFSRFGVYFYLGYHRLAITDISLYGDQPFSYESNDRIVYVMCNGEIYNYKELTEQFILPTRSVSDCEVIPFLYIRFGIEKLYETLDGEFAIIILDISKITGVINVHVMRDPSGVRPLYGMSTSSTLCFSSELIGIYDPSFRVDSDLRFDHIPPFSILTFKSDQQVVSLDKYTRMNEQKVMDNEFHRSAHDNVIYHPMILTPPYHENKNISVFLDGYVNSSCFGDEQYEKLFLEIKREIRSTLKKCVKKRLTSDRPIGCLLSGGLDSSLIASISSKYLNKRGITLHTFSIGMSESTDRKYAEMVSEHISCNHTHITATTEDFLNSIETVIKTIESYDVTTVRASVGQYLVSKWISENTDIKVLLIGDGSDEITGGYLYFRHTPSALEFDTECRRLFNEIHMYDALRADRCIGRFGMEARVPYLDLEFVKMYLGIHPEWRIPRRNIDGVTVEKWLLRESFTGNYLPPSVLYRKKEAFSDGVSSSNNSWHSTLVKQFGGVMLEREFYKKVFLETFPNFDWFKDRYWLPKSEWVGEQLDPSARELKE